MVNDWTKLSVLIAGCGSIGKRHARVLKKLGVRDIRACDPAREQRAALLADVPSVRLYESFEQGLSDSPDAVIIGTPPQAHVPMAMQALHAGAHVLCEKPLSDRVDGIDALAALAAARNKKVMVALCFRYHEGLRKAKQMLADGRIGRLVSIRALVGEHIPSIRSDYRAVYGTGTFGAFDLTHEIDLAVWFAGQPVRKVHCAGGSFSDIGIAAPDVVEMLLEFHDRCTAGIHLDFFQQPRRRQFELIGTQGVIVIEFARWEQCTVSSYEAAKGGWVHEELRTERDDMFAAEDSEFLKAVADDKALHCTIAEGRKSVEVVVAAYRQMTGAQQ